MCSCITEPTDIVYSSIVLYQFVVYFFNYAQPILYAVVVAVITTGMCGFIFVLFYIHPLEIDMFICMCTTYVQSLRNAAL